ncbi:MAG: nitroreductase family protein [Candidatus Omnitrophica bacterium]|nr:nitroreductase family protein [Candidatus Omnitrophota bacterium]
MDTLNLIKSRRSVRKFTKYVIPRCTIEKILESGRWAPSGLNNQPWRFMVLESGGKDELAEYTKYSQIIKNADKIILVFIDKKASYNYEKDLMAIGACIQNMLLYIHSQKLGACWLGEILNKRDEINKLFKLNDNLQLQAAIAMGKPATHLKQGKRKNLENLILKRYKLQAASHKLL